MLQTYPVSDKMCYLVVNLSLFGDFYHYICVGLTNLSMRDLSKIIIAADSFKGSLSSLEVADAVGRGFRRVFPECEIRKVCIADGGEGTVEALVRTLGGEYVDLEVANPLMHPVVARYGIVDGGATAVVEMSAASGLPLLAVEERNPLKTSTYGTGEMIADALRRGCRKVLVGIGGSATCDAGVGMLRALGFRFLGAKGEVLVGGGEILERIALIDDSGVMSQVREAEFVVACDVTNPLYGEPGAAYVFAPQKGADAAMVERLDLGLRNFAEVVKRYNGVDIASLAGAGAAGGLGGGFVGMLNARLERGVDMVLGAIRFDEIIKDCDLVITGEGRLDAQTLMGKAPSGVLRFAQMYDIPVIAIGGAVVECDSLRQSGFADIVAVESGDISLQEAMRPDIATRNLERTAAMIAEKINRDWV